MLAKFNGVSLKTEWNESEYSRSVVLHQSGIALCCIIATIMLVIMVLLHLMDEERSSGITCWIAQVSDTWGTLMHRQSVHRHVKSASVSTKLLTDFYSFA